MADTPIIQEDRASFPAAEALTMGDVVTLDASAEVAKTAADDDSGTRWLVAFTDAALGELVTPVKTKAGGKMAIKVDGSGTAIAAGDDLKVGAGVLVKWVDGTDDPDLMAGAIALEAATTATTIEVYIY